MILNDLDLAHMLKSFAFQGALFCGPSPANSKTLENEHRAEHNFESFAFDIEKHLALEGCQTFAQ